MLGSVSNGGCAVALEAVEFPRRGAGDYRVGLLRLAVLENAGALEHEAAGLAGDSSDDSLESDEGRRTVTAVHHEVFDLSLPFDIAGVALGDAGPGQLRQVRALAIGFFIPALDRESSIRSVLHFSPSTR